MAYVECPLFECFYGGARGGGKSVGSLLEWARHTGQYQEHTRGLMLRRTYTELSDTIALAKRVYAPEGATWHAADQEFRFPGGGVLKCAHLDNDADAEKYQGHSYTRVYVEEIGNFPNLEPVLKLMAVLRSANGVPVGFRATGNPGGPGHFHVKARYIDPWPEGWKIIPNIIADPDTGHTVDKSRVFIPATVRDNKFLSAAEYIAQLRMIGNDLLTRAWVYGDWSVQIGSYFTEWNPRIHVISPFRPPRNWLHFRSCDWGSARPFCVGWYTIVSEAVRLTRADGSLFVAPKGAMIMFREWYGCVEGQYDRGLKMPVETVAEGIRFREREDRSPTGRSLIRYGVLDPACWIDTGGPTHAERFAGSGVVWSPAENRRTGRHGKLGGWDMVRHRLAGDDGKPMLYIMSNCTATIRTLPAMQHDEARIEDLDSTQEDHAVDCLRYACMSRPWIARDAPMPMEEHEPHAIAGDDSAYPVMRVCLEPLFRDEERQSRRVPLSHKRI